MTIEVANFVIMKMLIDQGSSVDILYWKTFKRMGLPLDVVVNFNEQKIGFSGERVDTRGYIDLDTKFGEGNECCKTIRIKYLLVDAKSSYNVLLERPSLNKLGAIVSTQLAMKFPSNSKSQSKNVVTLHSDQRIARECFAVSLRIPAPAPSRRPKVHQVTIMNDLDPRPNDEPHVEPKEETILWQLGKPG